LHLQKGGVKKLLMTNNEEFTEKESLQLITDMINKTKQSFHDTGFGPIMWGFVVTLCAFATFLSLQFDLILPFDIWILTIVAIVPQIIYSIRESKLKKVKTYNDVAMDFTWISFGISMGILAVVINSMISDITTTIPNYMEVRGTFRLNNHITGIYLIIYAIPTFISGGIMKFKPMLFGGVLCWLLAIVSAFTNGKMDMLLTAIAATCAWLIPGLIINARYRKAKLANV
jgi:hypothetical protein